jgi:type III secretion system needle length determinant
MEKVTEKPVSIPPEKTGSSVSPDVADPGLRETGKRFSSLLRKSGREKTPASMEKVRKHIDKGLDSVKKRLDSALPDEDAHVRERRGKSHKDRGSDAAQVDRLADRQTGRSGGSHVGESHKDRGSDAAQVDRLADRQTGRSGGSHVGKSHKDHKSDAAQTDRLADRQTDQLGGSHVGESHKDHKSDAAQTGLLDPAAMGHIAHPGSSASVDAPQATPDTAAAAHDIGEVAKQIAERILVTAPGSGTHQEVRIQLKSSVLDGSDVRIFREGGELKVVFVAGGKDAENFIEQNKGQLQQALGDRLKDERIQISVETRQGSAAESEHNEGRSRQQYVAPDYESSNDSQDR